MPNILQSFREEVSRIARKEVRAACDPLKKHVRVLRRTVREQQEVIAKLERTLSKVVNLSGGTPATLYTPKEEKKTKARVTAGSIKRHRHRLGLSQTELGQLLDVSLNSVVRWEGGKSRPRAQHQAALVRLRSMGVREVRKMLAE